LEQKLISPIAPPLSDAGTGSSAVGSNFLARYEKEIASGFTWYEIISVLPPRVKKYTGDLWITLLTMEKKRLQLQLKAHYP
jgi:hypothetical protein